MSTPSRPKHRSACLISAVLLATTAFSAGAYTTGKAGTTPQAQYQADVAHCKSGQSNQDQATCMHEAGPALEAAQRHSLDNGQSPYQQDQAQRCQAFSGDPRDECMALMSRHGNVTNLSRVGTCRVLSQTTIPVLAKPSTSA